MTAASRSRCAPAWPRSPRRSAADWASLTPGAEELSQLGARPADARAAEEFYLRTWGEPSVDVHGIAGGEPHLTKTVLPVFAEANVSIRLAPGQRVEEIAPVFERLLREAAPEGAEVEIELGSRADPGLVAPGSRAIELGQEAFERATGASPLLVRSGGTLPIVPALEHKGIPTIVTGFAIPGANAHAPNERCCSSTCRSGSRRRRSCFDPGRLWQSTS